MESSMKVPRANGGGDNTPCRPAGQEKAAANQQQKEELDKMSHLVLWYGDNHKSPMYSLIRQTSFNAYEEGIAKGESLVPLKSTLRKSTDNNDDNSTLLTTAAMTTVVCDADGYDEEETTTTMLGDGSGGESTKQKRGFEDFMARSPSSKNKFDAQNDVVEVTLLREDSDAFDGTDDGADHYHHGSELDNNNNNDKNHGSLGCAPAGRFTAANDDKEEDHDDIEVLWKEEVEKSDEGFNDDGEQGEGRGPDDIVKEVMDKFLVEVKVEEEWNEAKEEQQQDSKYAVVNTHQSAEKQDNDDSTKQQEKQEQEKQDDIAGSECTMEEYIQEAEEEQVDKYAVKTNPSENQENGSSKENDATSLGECVENQNNEVVEIETMEEEEEEEEKPADEDISEKAVEEEVIFMSRDSSEDADEQQHHDVAKNDDVVVVQAEEQPEFGFESSDKMHDQHVVMFSEDNSAAADEEVAAIVEPDPDAETIKTAVQKNSEENEGEQMNITPKLPLRRPIDIKMDQVTQVAMDSKESENGQNNSGSVMHEIPLQRPMEMQAAKVQAMANKVKCTLEEAMEDRDVWYEMSLTSRDESIAQDPLPTSSVPPPPFSPRTASDMTGSKDSSSEEEDDTCLSYTHFDGDSVNEGPFQIIIEGAGTQEVNGVYHQDGYYGSACRYSKKGHWKGGPCTFYLCQCIVHDGTRSWFLSLVPEGCPVVTGYFYSAPVTKACRHIPPLKGWDKAVHGQKPRPTLSYRSKLAEENMKLTAEKEALEQQNVTLSQKLIELKATFKQQKESWFKEKETWEQQQKDYEDDLSENRDQMEQFLKDIVSLRATVVDYECKEKKLKDEIVYLRSAVTAHELQLKLVLHNQSLQLEVAQYEKKDPEELKVHTKALQAKVAQYKQQEQQQQQMKTNNSATNAAGTVKHSSSPTGSSNQVTIQKEAAVATEKVKNTLCLPHPLI